MDARTFRVDGMGCTGGERSVETALRRVDGVDAVEADFHTRTVEVTVDEREGDARAAGEGHRTDRLRGDSGRRRERVNGCQAAS